MPANSEVNACLDTIRVSPYRVVVFHPDSFAKNVALSASLDQFQFNEQRIEEICRAVNTSTALLCNGHPQGHDVISTYAMTKHDLRCTIVKRPLLFLVWKCAMPCKSLPRLTDSEAIKT